MKFLILNTDYSEFLYWLYNQNPGLEKELYEEQMRRRNDSLFGVADFYSSNLRKLGHQAHDIHINNEFMQKAWAGEHGLKFKSDYPWRFRMRKKIIPWISRSSQQRWYYDILRAQIEYYQPDVLINQAIEAVGSRFLREIKSYVRLLVGQIASPLPEEVDFSYYDLIISSLPNFVDYFRKMGIVSELHRLGFEPLILSRLKKEDSKIAVSFVGSLSGNHTSRVRLLEYLCGQIDVRIWGAGIGGLAQKFLIRRCYQGVAWGTQMYQILYNSKITLNHHIDLAESFANNMRLFEATGIGTLLITDYKINLHEMFEPGKEVMVYRSPGECAELIKYYLKHEGERQAVAQAGQQRILQNHTYYQRMQELVDIVHNYL